MTRMMPFSWISINNASPPGPGSHMYQISSPLHIFPFKSAIRLLLIPHCGRICRAHIVGKRRTLARLRRFGPHGCGNTTAAAVSGRAARRPSQARHHRGGRNRLAQRRPSSARCTTSQRLRFRSTMADRLLAGPWAPLWVLWDDCNGSSQPSGPAGTVTGIELTSSAEI
jgi:hypothetical protein